MTWETFHLACHSKEVLMKEKAMPESVCMCVSGVRPLGGGSYSARADQQPRRSGDGRSAGNEARWEVASRVQPRLGPQQQPRRLWHAGIPGCRGV